jgi:hypothetical protein
LYCHLLASPGISCHVLASPGISWHLLESPGISCESRDDEFSPFQTSIKMRKNKHLASQKHSNISEEIQLKDLCRVSENFGYLNKKLPANFVRDFLCQFYQIFKKKISMTKDTKNSFHGISWHLLASHGIS